MIELLLVDDHEVVRRGLRDLFEAEEDLIVVAEAGTVAEAEALVLPPGIVGVLDVRLPWCGTFSTSTGRRTLALASAASDGASMSPTSRTRPPVASSSSTSELSLKSRAAE